MQSATSITKYDSGRYVYKILVWPVDIRRLKIVSWLFFCQTVREDEKKELITYDRFFLTESFLLKIVRLVFLQSWLGCTFYIVIQRHMQPVHFLLHRSLYLREVLKRNEGISDAHPTSLHESSARSSKTKLSF